MNLTLQQVNEFLAPFVSEYSTSRYDLTKPFICGEYIVATNRLAIVRIARHYLTDPDCITHEEMPTGLPIDDIYRDACKRESNLLPISLETLTPTSLRHDQTQHCVCDNGFIQGTRAECWKCDGDGVVECAHCGHVDDCDECDGEGRVDGTVCPLCLDDNPTVFRIGVNDFALRVIKPICALPGILFHHELTQQNCVTFFAWQYGDGVAMPVELESK